MASRPTADVEENALGTLQENQYMLIPTNWKIIEFPVNRVGAGMNPYNTDRCTASGVYALAKAQALDFGWDNVKAIKWAVLRMQAFLAGWFDHQNYTMFKQAPPDCEKTFAQDTNEFKKYLITAWTLSSFLPLLAEFQFRVYGTSYQKTRNQAEYVQIAYNFASMHLNKDLLTYMDTDVLFGCVLLWVDVKRPMEVLKDPEACGRVRYAFRVGMHRNPAEKSLITMSVAIIDLLERDGWWTGIKEAGRYEDEKLITVYDKMVADPWKYHIMHKAYGVKELSVAELEEVEEGKKLAILFAPVLQAYVDALGIEGDLGKAKVLKKYAYANREVYSRSLEQFKIAFILKHLLSRLM